jgi:HD-GYP domain-containing protein (c-di-GMP phosphodiesterase class II)
LIKTIVATIDARGPVTSGHSERVARYSLALGKTMDLNREELGILEYAALLHDVGKIGIRDEILSKPGRYTPEEYEAVKRHPIISKDILEKAYFTGNQKQIPFLASSHHEKLDGTGYPLGLRADQIPTIARIIAVTDVYDPPVSHDTPSQPKPL